jgi:hypothetical protein
MNEDKKSKYRKKRYSLIRTFILAKISPAANFSMQQLLSEYLKLLVPQTKSNQTEENENIKPYSTESNNTKGSLLFTQTIQNKYFT